MKKLAFFFVAIFFISIAFENSVPGQVQSAKKDSSRKQVENQKDSVIKKSEQQKELVTKALVALAKRYGNKTTKKDAEVALKHLGLTKSDFNEIDKLHKRGLDRLRQLKKLARYSKNLEIGLPKMADELLKDFEKNKTDEYYFVYRFLEYKFLCKNNKSVEKSMGMDAEN